jgi:hypothetical protein
MAFSSEVARSPRLAGAIAAMGIALIIQTEVRADAPQINAVNLLQSAAVAANTRSIATRLGYPLSNLQVGGSDAKPEPGDQVTALVSLSSLDGKLSPTQWIIQLRRESLAAPAASALARGFDFAMYTNVGDTFVFHSAVTAMEMETLGPIGAETKPDSRPEMRRSRIRVDSDFLSLDLNRTARVLIGIQQQAEKIGPSGNFNLDVRGRPFPPNEWDANRRSLAALQLTPDDRRSFAGSIPALMQFLDIVRRTPDLQGILLQVLDKPSVIDVIRHGGHENMNFNFIGAGRSSHGQELFWKSATDRELSALIFNLEIFGKPVLTTILYVTPPRPPLEVSAGIVGIIALSPTNPNKVIVVKVLSSAPGDPASKN